MILKKDRARKLAKSSEYWINRHRCHVFFGFKSLNSFAKDFEEGTINVAILDAGAH